MRVNSGKFTSAALLIAAVLAAGCAAGFQIKGPIPPIEQHEAMTAFIMTELSMPDSTHDHVFKIVTHNSEMKAKIQEMAAMGRVNKYDLRTRRFRRFRIEMEALLPEEKYNHLQAVLSAIQRNESRKDNSWRTGNTGSPMSGPTDETF